MKVIIAIILIVGVASGLTAAPDSLTTTDGRTYQGITLLRADPDGLYLEYTLPGNGLGSAKVKFSRLSRKLKKQYGYDSSAASQYEEDARQGELAYQAWANQQDAARQRAQAEAVAFQVQTAASLAPARAMSSEPAAQPPVVCSPPGYFGGLGSSAGSPAPGNASKESISRGFPPPDRVYTPASLQINRSQAGPAFSKVVTRH